MSYMVMRQDDNGNIFEMRPFPTEAEAEAYAKTMTDKGHKQHYWVEKHEL